jgi:hypothetical protein
LSCDGMGTNVLSQKKRKSKTCESTSMSKRQRY